MHLGQRSRQASVAFILCDRYHAGLGNAEVRPADADVGLKVFQAHLAPGNHGQLFGAVGGRRVRSLFKEIADFRAGEVHGREHQVIRGFLPKLDDVFTQVGFNHFVACLPQRFVEVNLFGRHAL